jgi:hypothetical protein
LIFSLVFLWCVENIEALATFALWKRPEMYSFNGPAGYTKLYSVRSILSHYQSPMNWLFGLGPGHTVSRLGAWFIKDYWNILGPLGATNNPISQEAIDFIHNFWLAYTSSLYSPLFGWAGIWGDLGLMGLGTYLCLDYLVWRYCGLNSFLKINLLCVLALGFIFTQMEEPGYMLSIAAIMGLSWQEQQLKNRGKQYLSRQDGEIKFGFKT